MHSSWIIRAAQTQDIPAMLVLWKDVEEIKSNIIDTVERVQDFLEINQSSFLVAVDGENLIGTIMGGYNGWRGGIYHLVVDPKYRGLGIGRDLMDQCLTALYERGAPRVDLTTLNFNINAQAFYRQMGFVQRTDIKNFSYSYDKK